MGCGSKIISGLTLGISDRIKGDKPFEALGGDWSKYLGAVTAPIDSLLSVTSELGTHLPDWIRGAAPAVGGLIGSIWGPGGAAAGAGVGSKLAGQDYREVFRNAGTAATASWLLGNLVDMGGGTNTGNPSGFEGNPDLVSGYNANTLNSTGDMFQPMTNYQPASTPKFSVNQSLAPNSTVPVAYTNIDNSMTESLGDGEPTEEQMFKPMTNYEPSNTNFFESNPDLNYTPTTSEGGKGVLSSMLSSKYTLPAAMMGMNLLNSANQAKMAKGVNDAQVQSYQDYLKTINPPEDVKATRFNAQKANILTESNAAARRMNDMLAARGIRGKGAAAPTGDYTQAVNDAVNRAYFDVYGKYNVPSGPGPANYSPSAGNIATGQAAQTMNYLLPLLMTK